MGQFTLGGGRGEGLQVSMRWMCNETHIMKVKVATLTQMNAT
jgi:hypothetical protein